MERRLSTLALMRRATETRLRGDLAEARRALGEAQRRVEAAEAALEAARTTLAEATRQAASPSGKAGRRALDAAFLAALRERLETARAHAEEAEERRRAATVEAEAARARLEQAIRDRSAAEAEGAKLALLRRKGRDRREQDAADEIGQRRGGR